MPARKWYGDEKTAVKIPDQTLRMLCMCVCSRDIPVQIRYFNL